MLGEGMRLTYPFELRFEVGRWGGMTKISGTLGTLQLQLHTLAHGTFTDIVSIDDSLTRKRARLFSMTVVMVIVVRSGRSGARRSSDPAILERFRERNSLLKNGVMIGKPILFTLPIPDPLQDLCRGRKRALCLFRSTCSWHKSNSVLKWRARNSKIPKNKINHRILI